MGPGTASLPGGPLALGEPGSGCSPRTPAPRLQGVRRALLDPSGVSPADFFWDSGVWLRTTAVTGGGLRSQWVFLELLAGGTRCSPVAPPGQGGIRPPASPRVSWRSAAA